MRTNHSRGGWVQGLGAALLLLLGSAAPSEAQYFGRNKVQYRTFDFRILQTPHFDVYFYPEEEAAARDAARMAERWYHRLSQTLGHEFEERQPLVLYATHPHFQQTNTTGGSISEGTGGFTEAFKQRVVMPFAYSYEETDHVLGHELVHAFQYDISGLGRAGGGLEAAARRYQVPLWFTEGMAEYLSVGPVDSHTAMWVRDAALRGEIPSIERMTRDPRVFPYRWGQALWAYIGGRWGDATIGQILKLAGEGVPYPEAFERILNISLEDLSDDWHASIRRSYLPMLSERPEAREVAEPLITESREGGRLNVAPALSPDGRYVAFISELDFLDAELYLADAETGRVIRRLQKGTAFDPHFGSLRYINSAGTWSPDSRRFAFSAQRGGADVLVLIDVERGRRLREIEVPGVGEISNPSWSPDGRSIAFTGLSGGLSDLYLLDLESEAVRRLTEDAFTEMHPSFSPDGSSLAFVTERGPGTDLERLVYGPYRLAVMRLASGEIQLVPGMAGTKNISPAWTADGQGLFFLSNRDGIPNVYRVSLVSGEVRQVTRLFSGVSGITDVSPALTVARGAERLLFTAYESGEYNIYALEGAERLLGTPIEESPLPATAREFPVLPQTAWLPPLPRAPEAPFNQVAEMLADSDAGLPSRAAAASYAVVPYRAKLGLDYLGQPQVGVSAGGPFGGGVSGAVAGIFSDVLGQHRLMAAVQAQGQWDEIGGALVYLNSQRRWNYGVGLQRTPIVYGYYGFGVDTLSGVQVPTQDLIRARFFDNSLQGFAQYPFSQVQRVEFAGGLRRMSNDAQVYRLLLHPQTFQPIDQRQFEMEGFSLNMGELSAALVYDNALMGYTSPFAGQRYRFQLSQLLGDLQMVQALGDYRRYQFLRPFTLAVQGLHSGKYGRDSDGMFENQRVFYDQYLGQPWYVRGYYDSYSRCQERGGESCEVLNQLFGSRIAVAKAEVRFPLIRQLVIGSSFGLPPIEGFGFFDAGLAWNSATSPTLQRGIPTDTGERGWMTSAGVGLRANLFGYIVVEVDYLRAFALDEGWRWQFNFLPGF